ncbi:MAG: 2,3-bisphosphoglycerate-independent phosphoglycerate mutase [Verrucomicrobiota bacterium]
MAKKPVALIIRDGWGDNPAGEEGAEKYGDCPRLANTPNTDALNEKYPSCRITGSGMEVGLPDGQMGNSEVGHLNLGAGRIVYQDFTRINKAISDGQLAANETLQEALGKAKGARLHLVGLISDGGVHSHQDHVTALCAAAKEAGAEDILVHAITDGRDTAPQGGKDFVGKCEDDIAPYGAKIATVVGRYYAMDRDKRWERTKLGWDAIVHGIGEEKEVLASEAIAEKYGDDITDEFMSAMVFDHANEQRVRDGDVIIFFNFRADRARQLSTAILDKDFDGFDRGAVPAVSFYTMTEYDETYDCPAIFPPEELNDVLGKVVADAGLTQLRIAETEKYPHVSFFFNGGVEEPFAGEDRVLLQSPQDVATYDEKPEMSAYGITEAILEKAQDYDVIICNYANPDMVGHTGNVPAAVKAVEVIDDCVQQVVDKVLSLGGQLLITSDHGNCDQMIKDDGSPHTAHTTYPVPLIYVAEGAKQEDLSDGKLADIAPTILKLLGLDKPEAMDGESLVG